QSTTQRETVPSASGQDIRAEKSEELLFNTSLYTATFSNVGGVLKSFKLKNYTDGQGNPLELINQEVGGKVGWPLALGTGDKSTDEQLRAAQFASKSDAGQLVLEFAANGLYARKALLFDPESYQFTLETTVTRDGKALPHVLVWQGNFGDQSI